MVNFVTNSFKVIIASCGNEGGDLSKRIEFFALLTWEWTRTWDIPCPKFCLNEYQTRACIKNILYCIAFLDDGSGKVIFGKGVLAYNVNEGKWKANWRCSLPSPTCHHTNSIAPLLECNGELYLFLEHEYGQHVDHRIEKLKRQFSSANMVEKWKNVVKESKIGGHTFWCILSLHVYLMAIKKIAFSTPLNIKEWWCLFSGDFQMLFEIELPPSNSSWLFPCSELWSLVMYYKFVISSSVLDEETLHLFLFLWRTEGYMSLYSSKQRAYEHKNSSLCINVFFCRFVGFGSNVRVLGLLRAFQQFNSLIL